MQIKIENKILEFENDIKKIDQIFFEISKILEENNWDVVHILIDGKLVSKNYKDYIRENINTINEIIVIVNHLTVLIDEILSSAAEYIENSLTVIATLSEAFYQNPDGKDWNQLANLFDGIDWLINAQERIDQIKNLEILVKNYEIWNGIVLQIVQLKNVIVEMNEAMENQDLVLIGDLLNHEILPIFQGIKGKLNLLIQIGENNYVS